jgi:hypothetical protein
MNNVVYQKLSKDQINKYKDNCQTILSLSPKIRYVGILNNFGQTIAGQLRKGLVPLLKPDESRNEHFVEATRNRLRKEFESSIGKTVYTFTENEKVKMVVLSNETNICYVTFDKDTEFGDVMRIIQSTKKLFHEQI